MKVSMILAPNQTFFVKMGQTTFTGLFKLFVDFFVTTFSKHRIKLNKLFAQCIFQCQSSRSKITHPYIFPKCRNGDYE